MVIDDHLGYFIAIAEGIPSRPWNEWWQEFQPQLEEQLPRTQYLKLKFKAFHEICRILDDRGIEYETSYDNVNIGGGRLPFSHDPKESNPTFKQRIMEAEEKAMTKLALEPRSMGFCHMLWTTKKRILKEEYGIDWKTPAEMNPTVFLD